MIREKITGLRVILAGESYWKCRLSNGKWLSELDEKAVKVNDRLYRTRRLEWLEDIIGSGDIKKIKEIQLHTPKGTAHVYVQEEYTAFQFSQGTMSMFSGERIKNVQVIGAVIDKESGDCTTAIWDYSQQKLYIDTIFVNGEEVQGYNNVHNFKVWRDGIIPIGKLNVLAMDTRQ